MRDLRSLLAPLLSRWLARDPGEVARRAGSFAIRTEKGRLLIARLGDAFIDGYNAMLRADGLAEVAARGRRVDPHYRPFFFEGAAMGYLPRGWLGKGASAPRAERDLLGMDPGFRYLYYVGLGFWMAFRHRGRPEALLTLRPHLDPTYLPLCADGFGFKTAFFDDPAPARLRALARRCPEALVPALHQGFGRALFFVHMDDAVAFGRTAAAAEPDRRGDMVFGRSLALGFTGVDQPERLMEHLAAAPDPDERAARLTGLTWALTARDMNDPGYLAACLRNAAPDHREFLAALPGLCLAALKEAEGYARWQELTRGRVVRAYADLTSAGQAPRSA